MDGKDSSVRHETDGAEKSASTSGQGSSQTQRVEYVLAKHTPWEVVESLSQTVFPVSIRFAVKPQRKNDTAHPEYTSPDYPVTVRQSGGTYIPTTTVYIDNPAVTAPRGEKIWKPAELCAKLREVCVDSLISDMSAARLSLLRFVAVEVPQRYITADSKTGETVVKPELYEDEEEMEIVTFEKNTAVNTSDVREKLGDAVTENDRTPARLTSVKTVIAKPQRHGSETVQKQGLTQYFTEAEAEATNDLSRTPAKYESESARMPGSRSRPLSVIADSLEKKVPDLLTDSDGLVTSVTFVGEETTQTVFRAEEVRE